MKRGSNLVYLISLIVVLVLAAFLTAMSSAAPAARPPAAHALQETVVVTPPVEVTPPVVMVTGTAAPIPVTGAEPLSTSWLFLAILVVAGLAFLVAIIALMRRPYP